MLQQKSGLKDFTLYLLLIFFCMLNVSNIKIAGFSDVMPMFDVMAIFYFSVLKNRLGIWFLFLLGIWNDSLNGTPFGTTALCYILLCRVFEIANNRILVKENFDHIWRQFIIFCTIFLVCKWLFISIFNGFLVSPISALAQLVISSLIYVPMHRFFDYFNAKIPE